MLQTVGGSRARSINTSAVNIREEEEAESGSSFLVSLCDRGDCKDEQTHICKFFVYLKLAFTL